VVVQAVTQEAARGIAVLVAVEIVALLQQLVLLEEVGIAGNKEEEEEEVVGEWHPSVEVAVVKQLM